MTQLSKMTPAELIAWLELENRAKSDRRKELDRLYEEKRREKAMKAITITIELARAIGADAANRRMRKAGRKKWNRADYNLACRVMRKVGSPDDGRKVETLV